MPSKEKHLSLSSVSNITDSPIQLGQNYLRLSFIQFTLVNTTHDSTFPSLAPKRSFDQSFYIWAVANLCHNQLLYLLLNLPSIIIILCEFTTKILQLFQTRFWESGLLSAWQHMLKTNQRKRIRISEVIVETRHYLWFSDFVWQIVFSFSFLQEIMRSSWFLCLVSFALFFDNFIHQELDNFIETVFRIEKSKKSDTDRNKSWSIRKWKVGVVGSFNISHNYGSSSVYDGN